MHVVPPQSAPDWLKATPLADPANPAGYVEVDKHTMQHTRYPNVFALGDAGSTPNSKTGAAIRKQAPVVAEQPASPACAGKAADRLLRRLRVVPADHGAATRCCSPSSTTPMQPAPSFPFIDTTKERRDMWYLKRYGLPALYWNLMLKGRA